MNPIEIKNRNAFDAALCYFGIGIFIIINRMFFEHYYIINRLYAYYSHKVIVILYLIIVFANVLTLFLNIKKVYVFAIGSSALINLYFIIDDIRGLHELKSTDYFDKELLDILAKHTRYDIMVLSGSVIAFTLLVVFIFFSIKGRKIKLWYLPSVVLFVCHFIWWILVDSFDNIRNIYYRNSIIVTIIECVAILLVGMSLNATENVVDSVYSIGNSQQLSNNTQPHDDVIGGADKLRTYKELLDSGVITQEEFEQKKKQILGL